jgi:hypothetical protein
VVSVGAAYEENRQYFNDGAAASARNLVVSAREVPQLSINNSKLEPAKQRVKLARVRVARQECKIARLKAFRAPTNQAACSLYLLRDLLETYTRDLKVLLQAN